MKTILQHAERYSVVKLKDGTIGVWERKGKMLITEWNKTGKLLPLSTEVEVIKNPCHLAADYLASLNTQPKTKNHLLDDNGQDFIDMMTADRH